MSKRAKIVLLVVLMIIIGFVGFVAYCIIGFAMQGAAHVYSDSKAHEALQQKRKEVVDLIYDHFDVAIPENATGLYFSHHGSMMGYEQYAAFRFTTEEECMAFFNEARIDITRFEKGKLSSGIPWDRFRMPHKWGDKFQDTNWKLSEGDEILYRSGMIYIPDEHRIYMFSEAGP